MIELSGPVPVTATSKPFKTIEIEQSVDHGLLDAHGYVEEEFFVSGGADALGLDGRASTRDVPFTTRVLVRRPADPARFSGSVTVEPFHVMMEVTGSWMNIKRLLLRQGDAWVGVTVSAAPPGAMGPPVPSGVELLKLADAERYAPIELHRSGLGPLDTSSIAGHEPPDFVTMGSRGSEMMGRYEPQAPSIISQVAELLRTDPAGRLLGGRRADRVYANGYSQTGMFWRTFIDDGHHDAANTAAGRPVFDAYLIGVSMEPANKPADAVVVAMPSEAEATSYARSGWTGTPDTDDPRFRVYEVPGSYHFWSPVATIDDSSTAFHLGRPGQTLSFPCAPKHNERPFFRVVHAIHDAIERWVRDGVPAPRAERIARDPDTKDLVRDEHGNAVGGVRNPWVDVPDATYSPTCDCMWLIGSLRAFTQAEMKELYGSDEAYRKRLAARVDELVAEGWLLPEDGEIVKADPFSNE